MLHSRWKALCVVFLVLAGCDELTELDPGMCGNHVVDGDRDIGEDCDGFPEGKCGQPGDGARACRFVCEVTADCKPNWACQDGICREPSGGFEQVARSIAAKADWMDVADFDGDGQADLLAGDRDHIDLHYVGLDFGTQKTVPVPVGRTLPQIGNLTDDTLPDIVTTARDDRGGIVVLRAQADRTLSHTAYSSFDIPDDDGIGIRILGVELDPSRPGDEAAAFSENPNDLAGSTSVLFLPFLDEGEQFLHLVEFPANDLAGDVLVGELDERLYGPDSNMPCDELVYARLHADTVNVLHGCRTFPDSMAMQVLEINLQFGGMGDFVPPTPVSLPAGANDIQRVGLFDVNGDAHLDLVIDATHEVQGRRRVFVAYGVGDGTFHSSEMLPPPGTPGDGVASLYMGFPYFPLAMGHLDEDGIPDFVTRCFICSSAATYLIGAECAVAADVEPCEESELPPPQGEPGSFREAFIGDMNDNGLPDVAVTFDGRTGIRFYSGAGSGAYNLFEIPTDAEVAHLTPGDFDGDLLPDLALAQRDEPTSHALAILFGRRDIDPTPPVVIGRIGEILQLTSTSLSTGEPWIDAITDLGALSKYSSGVPGETRVSVALLQGRTDRQIHAPHALSYEQRGSGESDFVTDVALVPAIGQLTDDDHLDVAALGGGAQFFGGNDTPVDGYRIWVVPATGDAELDRVRQKPTPIDDGFVPTDSMAATEDFNGDGIDELVLLQSRVDGGGRFLVAELDGDAWGMTAPVDVEPEFPSEIPLDDVGAGPTAYNRIAVLDVDGDAATDPDLDVVALARVGGVVSIVVFQNADGRLAFEAPVALGLPDGELMGYTFIQAEDDAPQEIAAITSEGVFLGHVMPDLVVYWQPLIERETNTGPLPHAIAAHDMNGDGIQDLLLSRGSEIEIHLGLKRKP